MATTFDFNPETLFPSTPIGTDVKDSFPTGYAASQGPIVLDVGARGRKALSFAYLSTLTYTLTRGATYTLHLVYDRPGNPRAQEDRQDHRFGWPTYGVSTATVSMGTGGDWGPYLNAGFRSNGSTTMRNITPSDQASLDWDNGKPHVLTISCFDGTAKFYLDGTLIGTTGTFTWNVTDTADLCIYDNMGMSNGEPGRVYRMIATDQAYNPADVSALLDTYGPMPEWMRLDVDAVRMASGVSDGGQLVGTYAGFVFPTAASGSGGTLSLNADGAGRGAILLPGPSLSWGLWEVTPSTNGSLAVPAERSFSVALRMPDLGESGGEQSLFSESVGDGNFLINLDYTHAAIELGPRVSVRVYESPEGTSVETGSIVKGLISNNDTHVITVTTKPGIGTRVYLDGNEMTTSPLPALKSGNDGSTLIRTTHANEEAKVAILGAVWHSQAIGAADAKVVAESFGALSGRAVALSWSPPAHTGGAPITGYVAQAVGSNGSAATFKAKADATSILVKAPEGATAVALHAVNAAGMSIPVEVSL